MHEPSVNFCALTDADANNMNKADIIFLFTVIFVLYIINAKIIK